ncbi:hypothetical protein ACHAWF_013441 [Thalassiosira exigua]
MFKKPEKRASEEREPLFVSPDDDGGGGGSGGGGNGSGAGPAANGNSSASTPPPVRYRDVPADDAPQASDGGPFSPQFIDDPGHSIFDWGDGESSAGTGGGGDKEDAAGGAVRGDLFQADEFDSDSVGFAPVSLHDDDEEEEEGGDEEDGRDGDGRSDRIRRRANEVINQRVWDDAADDHDDDRIFVGGGWGRHGSQFSCCPRGCCSCCKSKPKYAPQLHEKKGRGRASLCGMVCAAAAFGALVFGSAYVGYEAGLPADGANETEEDAGDDDGPVPVHRVHTKGDEWLEWLKHEKQNFHMPHLNFTLHHKSNVHNAAFNDRAHFAPASQPELLRTSENVFQSCSERSLRTAPGRDACLSLCKGRYCCFEKDVAFGSCVAEEHSYCFAYAACENVIADFGMNNANAGGNAESSEEKPQENVLNALDVQLLSDACAKANIATLEGMRDCTAFCQHHLCCFDELEGEGCREDHPNECQSYEPCRILVEGPDGNAGVALGGEAVVPGGIAGDKDEAVIVDPDFDAQCLKSNLQQHWDFCKTACQKYDCCFRRAGSCYEERMRECDAYYICEEYYLDEQEVVGPQGTQVIEMVPKKEQVGEEPKQQQQQPASGIGNDAIELAVHAVCGTGQDSSAGDDSWVAACHALCANHLCCFSPMGTVGSCPDYTGCDAYQECAVLHGGADATAAFNEDVGGGDASTNEGSAAEKQGEVDAVAQNCTPKAKQDPWVAEACRKACASRSCCYADGPGNCASMNPDWCNEFAPCDVLYT